MVLCLFALAAVAAAGELPVGYRMESRAFAGPGEWRQAVDPVWVWEYHALRLRYRVSGLPASDAAVLTLRPGAVGPVTPGATNPENPFAIGMTVAVIAARDLTADGALHTLDVELGGRTRTAQIDELQFALPAGAKLTVESLEFRADAGVFPCDFGGPALPPGVRRLAARGPAACGGAPATSLRGRESIHIDGGGLKGRALHLSLLANLAGVNTWSADPPFDRWLWKETTQTALLLARIEYADGSGEEQFPLLSAERRHAVLNRKPALYTLALDPSRALRRVELLDRSPHLQLALFAAGISANPAPAAADAVSLPPAPGAGKPVAEPDVSASRWYELRGAAGAVRAELKVTNEPGGRSASLSLTNAGREPREFTLIFPSLAVRPAADPGDVYYLFPQQGAVLGREEKTFEAAYSGVFPLQFVDVFAPAANCGAAVVVHDTGAQGKRFRLRKSGAVVAVEVEYAVRLAPGETVRYPGAQVVFHGGDWRPGFAAYRRWVTSWYRPQGPRPAWLRSAFWARRDYPVGGSGKLFDVRTGRYTFDALLADAEDFGGAGFIDISGWALSDKAGRVGDYPVELGGIPDLARNIALARRRGVPTGLYFEGYLIDRGSNVGRRSAAEWQIIDAAGKPKWWRGGSPEFFACPYVEPWREFLSGRVAEVVRQVGAGAVYLDEFGFGNQRCYSAAHGHPVGVGTMQGELAMVRAVRASLNAAGRGETAIYIEETPPDAAAPFYDAAFCYAIPMARQPRPAVKLNLWRFVFPDVRLWDMVSLGVHPRELPPEDFRLSLWHGNGAWLKGHSATWYSDETRAFLRRAHTLLRQHAAAFAGTAEPLVESPHPALWINRFSGGGETVYTLFNASYRTVRATFQGRAVTLAPREVEVLAVARL